MLAGTSPRGLSHGTPCCVFFFPSRLVVNEKQMEKETATPDATKSRVLVVVQQLVEYVPQYMYLC